MLTNKYLQIVCENKDIYASGCAVARAFPLYNKKTSLSGHNEEAVHVTVEFIVVPSSNSTSK